MPPDRTKRASDPLLSKEKRKSASPSVTKTVGDVGKARIHRVRFVDYRPSSICSLALTPASWDATVVFSHARKRREVLAVGRGNGDIEIHVWIGLDGEELSKRPGSSRSQKQAWVAERTLSAHLPSGPVDHLVFTHQTDPSESDLDLMSSPQEIDSAKGALLRTPPRLFASTGSSTLLEWDWVGASGGRPKASLSSEGGTIWSLATNPASTKLAMGCEDGVIRIINIQDGDFEIVRRLDKVNTRCLSLAWGPPAPRVPTQASSKGKERATVDDVLDDVYLVAGGADSALRKWDLRSGRCIAKLQTDVSGREATLVWSIAVLSDHTIVSGDSMGIIKIWDGVMSIQRQSHKAHKADILCMTISADERHIYTAGVDQMIVQLSLISADKSQKPDTSSRPHWIIATSRRLHNHDVRAIAHSPAFTFSRQTASPPISVVPILLSGGIDMAMSLTPASPAGASAYAVALEKLGNPLNEAPSTIFDRSTQRKTPFVPQRARAVHVAREARLLVSRSEKTLKIWRLLASASSAGSLTEDSEDSWHRCCEITLNCATNLVASAISPDGQWLAVSDCYEAKLFALTPQMDGTIEPKRVKDFATALDEHASLTKDKAAATFVFTPDSRRLVIAGLRTSYLAILRLPINDMKACQVLKIFSHHAAGVGAGRAVIQPKGKANGTTNGVNGHARSDDSSSEGELSSDEVVHVAPIACLAVSDDGQWLASADMARRLHAFHLDSLQHQCALPSPDVPPTALAFIPLAPSQLIVGLPNNTLQIFDVELRRIASWAKGLTTDPIKPMFDLREPLVGLALEPLHSKQTNSASASPLPSPMAGLRGNPLTHSSASPSPRPRIPVVVAWGSTWLCRIRLPAAMPVSASPTKAVKRSAMLAASANDSSGEGEHSVVRDGDVQVSHRYQPLLALDFLGPGELVVAERPYFSLAADLPPAFYALGKYGT